MNGYNADYRLVVGAKKRELTYIPDCDKTKKVIRGSGKLNGQRGWKGQLFFKVDLMSEERLGREHPIQYDVHWRIDQKWAGPGEYPSGVCWYPKKLGFPCHHLRPNNLQTEVCGLFEDEETPGIVQAYFKLPPPGYEAYEKMYENAKRLLG